MVLNWINHLKICWGLQTWKMTPTGELRGGLEGSENWTGFWVASSEGCLPCSFLGKTKCGKRWRRLKILVWFIYSSSWKSLILSVSSSCFSRLCSCDFNFKVNKWWMRILKRQPLCWMSWKTRSGRITRYGKTKQLSFMCYSISISSGCFFFKSMKQNNVWE